MPIERWSDNVVVVHLGDDPQFTEDLDSLDGPATATSAGTAKSAPNGGTAHRPADAVLDFAAVHFINSSNLARLLKLRQKMVKADAKLILCGMSTQVWGTFLVTGLDKVFAFSDNVPTSLATLQIKGAARA
ncbi:MAG: STAS domain-containing protein [Tepidisphaeraceae bacterium]